MSRLAYVVVLSLLLLTVGIYFAAHYERAPSYGGRDWYEWHQTWYTNSQGSQVHSEAEAVLRDLGRKNISYFVRTLRNRAPFPTEGLRAALYQLPYLGPRLFQSDFRATRDGPNAARDVLELLGPEASPAIPQLVALFRTETNGWVLSDTSYVLRQIGPQIAPACREMLLGDSQTARYWAPALVVDSGLVELYPHLIRGATDSDPDFAAACVFNLGRLTWWREEPWMNTAGATTALTNALTSTNAQVIAAALDSLTEYGRDTNVLPLVEMQLNAPDKAVREAAADAWHHLSPGTNRRGDVIITPDNTPPVNLN